MELSHSVFAARSEDAVYRFQRADEDDNGGPELGSHQPGFDANDKSKQASSGGPITQDNTSIEYYDTVFTLRNHP